MGYHVRPIVPQGVYGHISKVLEEADEYAEAMEQGNQIMATVELADIYGALQAVARQHNLTMGDLAVMSQATSRAFHEGIRKPKDVQQ